MVDITRRSTSEEIADPDSVSRERVLKRLADWHDRVYELYDGIERELESTRFKPKREQKYAPPEEFARRFDITETEQPRIDALHIVRQDDTDAAILYPRGLWIIGANGRVDLRITPPVGTTETYMLVDVSEPLTRPAKWLRMPIGSPFDREPFDSRWLLSKLR